VQNELILNVPQRNEIVLKRNETKNESLRKRKMKVFRIHWASMSHRMGSRKCFLFDMNKGSNCEDLRIHKASCV